MHLHPTREYAKMGFFEFDVESQMLDLARIILMGFTDSMKQVAALARFLCFNWEHLEVPDLAACASCAEYQELWLGARLNEEKEAKCLEVHFINSSSSRREVRRLWFRTLNPVLTQLMLSFCEGYSAVESMPVIQEEASKTWYNCVYNESGAKERPITFCIDASHTDTLNYFKDTYAGHILGSHVFALAVGSPWTKSDRVVADHAVGSNPINEGPVSSSAIIS
jgi:hypothetical protein